MPRYAIGVQERTPLPIFSSERKSQPEYNAMETPVIMVDSDTTLVHKKSCQVSQCQRVGRKYQRCHTPIAVYHMHVPSSHKHMPRTSNADAVGRMTFLYASSVRTALMAMTIESAVDMKLAMLEVTAGQGGRAPMGVIG